MAGEFKILDDMLCGQCRTAMVQWGRVIFCPKCQAPDGSYRRKYCFMPGKPIRGMPLQRTPPKNYQAPLL